MSDRSAILLVEDMIEAIERILDYTKAMTFNAFVKDTRTSDAVLRNLQILGEAANRIPDTVRSNTSEIEWQRIIRSRHVIVHDYFGVDYEIVWRITEMHLPPLLLSLRDLLAQLEDE